MYELRIDGIPVGTVAQEFVDQYPHRWTLRLNDQKEPLVSDLSYIRKVLLTYFKGKRIHFKPVKPSYV